MSCWICLDDCDNICCNCPGNIKNAHNYCIGNYVLKTNKNKCDFCKSNYKINLFYLILVYLNYFIERLFDFRYYNGKKWLDDDEYDIF